METEGGDANGDATLDAKDDADNDERGGNKRARIAKQKEEEVKESSGHEFSHHLPEATVNYFLSQKQIFDHQVRKVLSRKMGLRVVLTTRRRRWAK